MLYAALNHFYKYVMKSGIYVNQAPFTMRYSSLSRTHCQLQHHHPTPGGTQRLLLHHHRCSARADGLLQHSSIPRDFGSRVEGSVPGEGADQMGAARGDGGARDYRGTAGSCGSGDERLRRNGVQEGPHRDHRQRCVSPHRRVAAAALVRGVLRATREHILPERSWGLNDTPACSTPT